MNQLLGKGVAKSQFGKLNPLQPHFSSAQLPHSSDQSVHGNQECQVEDIMLQSLRFT